MKNKDKITHLDGLPGVTLPGYTGDKGVRGMINIFVDSIPSNTNTADSSIYLRVEDTLYKARNDISRFGAQSSDYMIDITNGKDVIYIIDSAALESGSTNVYECECTLLDSLSIESDSIVDGNEDADLTIEISGDVLSYTGWDGEYVTPVTYTVTVTNKR